MEIVFARIDDRLVHGQVMSSWTKQLQIKKIMVVDDDIAKDEFTAQVLCLAAPSGVTVVVKSVDDTIKEIEEDNSTVKTMLLFKTINYAKELVDKGYDLKRLDIGNIGSSPTRHELTKRVFMDDNEKEIARQLINHGVDVYIQMLHTDSEVSASKYL